jgi:hypothetical protein
MHFLLLCNHFETDRINLPTVLRKYWDIFIIYFKNKFVLTTECMEIFNFTRH